MIPTPFTTTMDQTDERTGIMDITGQQGNDSHKSNEGGNMQLHLRNGTSEEQAIVEMTMSALREIKEDKGTGGLLLARRAAMGRTPERFLETDYRLVQKGRMSQPVKNIILAAVTATGQLQTPLA
jgi:hypothetical protein